MSTQNFDKLFQPILDHILEGDIQTTHQLRVVIEKLAEQFDLNPLQLLVTFREWLLVNGFELSTEHGAVMITKK